MNETVGVVLLNWNSWQHTVKCIDSLLNGEIVPDQIVVVDNASVGSDVAEIQARFKNVMVLENAENIGFTGGNNVGIEYLITHGTDVVWMLNNDTYVDKSCLVELLRALKRQTGGAIIVPQILNPDGSVWFSGVEFNRWTFGFGHRTVKDSQEVADIRQIKVGEGCSLFFNSQVFRAVGPLDNNFFAYNEDVDWCLRAARLGAKTFYSPHAVVFHVGAGSTNRNLADFDGGRTSSFRQYLAIKNHLLLIRRHARGMYRWSAIMVSVSKHFAYACGVFFFARFKKAKVVLRALHDGLQTDISSVKSEHRTPEDFGFPRVAAKEHLVTKTRDKK